MKADAARLTQRGAAFALAAALAIVVAIGLVSPYVGWLRDLESRLAAKESLAARYRALAADPAPAASEPAPPRDAAALLLPRSSEAQAAAFLQEKLKAYAGEARVAIDGVQVLARGEAGQAAKVAVRVRGRGEIAAVVRFLYAVETARPVLLVEGVRIQGRGGRDTTSGEVDLQLDVAGFTAPGDA